MADDEILLTDVRDRTDDAIHHADIILLVLEYDKITDFDEYIVKKLRRSKKPVIIIANKADNPKRDLEAYNLFSLGLGDVVPMSAVQNR
jgi:GTP-binding protein